MGEHHSPLIDVHTHIVPRDFPPNPAPGNNGRWPCLCVQSTGRATIQFGDKPFRELDSRSWDIAARVNSMDAEGITAQALSPMPELLSYWFKPEEALNVGRFVNAAIASMVAQGNGRFIGLGMVPLQAPELAARELSRLKADGLAGVEIGSNINGTVLGDKCFTEFFAEAERLELAIFVHALHPIGAERLRETPDLIPYAAFPLDTGLAIASLLRAGVPAKFLKLRLGFSHGGGAVIPLVHRLQRGWELSDGFNGALPQPPHHYAANFFYDSLVYDTGYLKYLLDVFAPGHVFAGTDYPYVIEQTGLRKFLEGAVGAAEHAVFADAARLFLNVR